MKTIFLALLTLALTAQAADLFDPSKIDPLRAGMDQERLSKITARMQEFVDKGTAAGIVTLVVRHGQVAQLSAVGWQDREAKIPMQPDTLFQIMSITKPMTCAAIMTLVDEGRIALIDPVEKYLPDFKLPAPPVSPEGAAPDALPLSSPARPITILDLMTHTSGLPGSPPKGFNRSEHTLAEGVAAVAPMPREFDPGTKWHYCSMGIATLGRIIEVCTGKAYEDYMAERIFRPLAMNDTYFFLPQDKEDRLAVAYTNEEGTLKRNEKDRFRRGAKSPMPDGGLYSTATDVARFFQMLLNRGKLNNTRILSKSAVELMTKVHTGDLKTGFFPGAGWGLGLSIVKDPIGMFRYNSIGTFGHGGGYRTYAWVDPQKDIVGVFLCQRTNGGGDVADEMNAFMAMAAAAMD